MDQKLVRTIHRLVIDGYSSTGAGVARLDGVVVFVEGGIRCEVCDVLITKVGRNALWGHVAEAVQPSPARIFPQCLHYTKCGGCSYRHINYAEELEAKRIRVEDALQRIGGLTLEVPEILGARDTRRYRNKAQFPVSNGPKIGFYRARSHDVIDVEDCLLQREPAMRLRGAVKAWMEAWSIPAYQERTGGGLVRHVYVRTNRAGQSLCCLMINGRKIPREAELTEALRAAEPLLAGVVLGINQSHSNIILGESYRTLWGENFLLDTLGGLTFRISVPSFYQVNPEQTETLYAKALEFADLSGTETVLDLYCGIGTISLFLARKAGQVIGAEVVPEAVEDARENAARNGIQNTRFLCADAGEAALQLEQEGVRPDVVCVDPPRKGLAPDVIDTIAAMSPQRVVYVSCDPGTLARDLKLFAILGYEARHAVAVDLFPRTAHVETVVCLSRKNPDDRIEIELDLDELDITSVESKASYEEIKEYVLKNNNIKVSSLYISQVKRKLGLEVGTNYNLPKSEDSRVPQCPAEKEKVITEALKHFKMI